MRFMHNQKCDFPKGVFTLGYPTRLLGNLPNVQFVSFPLRRSLRPSPPSTGPRALWSSSQATPHISHACTSRPLAALGLAAHCLRAAAVRVVVIRWLAPRAERRGGALRGDVQVRDVEQVCN